MKWSIESRLETEIGLNRHDPELTAGAGGSKIFVPFDRVPVEGRKPALQNMRTDLKLMGVIYFKRFRMEVDLTEDLPGFDLPEGYFWREWSEGLTDLHAEIKFRSFCDEVDSRVFPILGDRWGCQRLMREIRAKPGFLPEATWLIGCDRGYCATIQGIVDSSGIGSIQNVAVLPGFRRIGLGQALVRKCLDGFLECGITRVMLEVTAENPHAVRMYRKLGFRKARTTYRAVTE